MSVTAGTRTTDVPTRRAAALLVLVLYAVAMLIFFNVLDDDLPTAVEIGLGILLISRIATFRRKSGAQATLTGGPQGNPLDGVLALSYLLVAAAMIVAAHTVKTTSQVVGVVFAVTALLAIGDFVLELRKAKHHVEIGIGMAAVAAICAFVGIVFNHPLVLVASFALAPASISMLSGTGSHPGNISKTHNWYEKNVRNNSHAILAGFACFVSGLLLIRIGFGGKFFYAGGIAVLVFILVSMVIANSNADVMVVAIIVAFAWSLQPRTTPDPADTLPATGAAILAIGDSYQSGEGSPLYIEGTNQSGHSDRLDNKCRRAATAYPVLLAQGLGGFPPQRLAFFSCSGAVANNFTKFNQSEGEGAPDQSVEMKGTKTSTDMRLGQPQLALAKNVGDVQTIYVSIGGNDIGFGDLVEMCLGPTNCADAEAVKVSNKLLKEYQKAIETDNFFATLQTDFPNAKRVLVPYPIQIREESCSKSPMTDGEHKRIVTIVKALNQINAYVAGQAGFVIAPTEMAFVSSGKSAEKILKDRRICGEGNAGSAVNLFALNPESNPLGQIAFPKNWFHNSVHPTPIGHRLIAARVLETPVEAPGSAWDVDISQQSNCTAKACLDSLKAIGQHQLKSFYVKLLLGLALVSASAMLLFTCMSRLTRPVLRALGSVFL